MGKARGEAIARRDGHRVERSLLSTRVSRRVDQHKLHHENEFIKFQQGLQLLISWESSREKHQALLPLALL